MESVLLTEGFEIMLAGMAVVFAFLTLLVGATSLMSRVVMRFRLADAAPEQEEEIAAISAAITRHRRKRRH
jgi:oxaloacetate decarboxylase (Na+ extruding) subunit gamma